MGYRELTDIAGGFTAFLVIILIYVFMLDARGRKLRKELRGTGAQRRGRKDKSGKRQSKRCKIRQPVSKLGALFVSGRVCLYEARSELTPSQVFNEEHRTRWGGSDGEFWAREQDRMDCTLTPVMRPLLDFAAPVAGIGGDRYAVAAAAGRRRLNWRARWGRRGEWSGWMFPNRCFESGEAAAERVRQRGLPAGRCGGSETRWAECRIDGVALRGDVPSAILPRRSRICEPGWRRAVEFASCAAGAPSYARESMACSFR